MSDVVLQAVSKLFNGSLAVDRLDLTIAEGEFFVLLGPSGCGKTTTLRSIAGLEEPDAGRIAIGGRTVVHPEQGVFVPPNKRDIGMVFQSYALWPHMTVHGNVAYPLKMRGRGSDERAIDEALALVGLTGYGTRQVAELSGGQQQRVALARAMVARPQLLLFDEPLSNLDAQLRYRLRNDLRHIHLDKGHTAVYVTHDQSEALALADRVAVMQHGRIDQLGSPAEIFLAPATRFVAEFVGFDNIVPARVTAAGDTLLALQPEGGGATLRALRPPGTVAPDVLLAIRNSSIRVLRDPARIERASVLPAVLRQVTYLGDRYHCTVQTEGGTTWNATMSLEEWGRGVDHDRALVGSTIHAVFPEHDLVVLPT